MIQMRQDLSCVYNRHAGHGRAALTGYVLLQQSPPEASRPKVIRYLYASYPSMRPDNQPAIAKFTVPALSADTFTMTGDVRRTHGSCHIEGITPCKTLTSLSRVGVANRRLPGDSEARKALSSESTVCARTGMISPVSHARRMKGN